MKKIKTIFFLSLLAILVVYAGIPLSIKKLVISVIAILIATLDYLLYADARRLSGKKTALRPLPEKDTTPEFENLVIEKPKEKIIIE